MKLYIIFAFLLMFGVLSQDVSYVSRHNRSSQSCHSSNTYGWFWTGQYCEACKSQECLCNKYRECLRCAPGYLHITSKIIGDDAYLGNCYKCPSITEKTIHEQDHYLKKWFDYNSTPSQQQYDKKTFEQSATHPTHGKERIFSTLEVENCCSPFSDDRIRWQPNFRKGLRAIQCSGSIPNIRQYQRIGSICFYLQGCAEYINDYDTPLRCVKCFQGFYLNERQECSTCNNVNYETTPPKNLNYCLECDGPDQCTKCDIGYVLAKNDFRTAVTSSAEDTLRVREYASYCIPCDQQNCDCQLQASESGNVNSFFIKGPISNYYFYDGSRCTKCDLQTGEEGCLTCLYDSNEPTGRYFKCTKCKTYDSLASQDYWSEIYEFKCYKCPANCTKCKYNATLKYSTCDRDFCFNGYRWVEKAGDNKEGQCIQCATIGTRCTSKNDMTEEITQCQTDGDVTNASMYYPYTKRDDQVGYMALTPPNDIDYYRIKVGTNYVCVKNVHFCREMLEGNTSGFCKSCYETSSKGIYMLVDFGSEYTVCAKCTIDNCTKCNKYAGAVKGDTANYLECSECTSGVDKTQYMTDVNNYYLYPLTETVGQKRICALCHRGCKKCTRQSDGTDICTATECQKGFGYNATTQRCSQCSLDNCQKCKQNASMQFAICTECFPNYRLWKGSGTDQEIRFLQVCESCEVGCAACQNERKICTVCQPEYYLWAGSCHIKKRNCVLHEYSQDNVSLLQPKCKICAYGYRLVDGRCMACFSPFGAQIHCHEGCSATFRTNVDMDKDRKGPNIKRLILRNLSQDDSESF